MLEQVQNQEPPLREMEGANFFAKAAWAGAKSNLQSVTASESAVPGEFSQLA